MKTITYVIYKGNGKWTMELRDHSEIAKSLHSSRQNALNAIFKRHSRLDGFHITLPNRKSGKDFVFEKVMGLWTVRGVSYPSRAKAISSFFAKRSGITLFYMSIQIKDSENA